MFVWLFLCVDVSSFFSQKRTSSDRMASFVSKRKWHSSNDFDVKRFKTFLDFQSFKDHFENAPTMVERIVRFDTLGSTFIPKIFADKNWANLFGNFEDPVDELVKEFYLNAWFTEAELKCWVRGKDFVITLDYLAKILHINRLANVEISPYDDIIALVIEILDIPGAVHEVSAKGTSIGTTKFKLELKILTLIMFFNLCPLTNTGFINLGRAQFSVTSSRELKLTFVLTFFKPWAK